MFGRVIENGQKLWIIHSVEVGEHFQKFASAEHVNVMSACQLSGFIGETAECD